MDVSTSYSNARDVRSDETARVADTKANEVAKTKDAAAEVRAKKRTALAVRPWTQRRNVRRANARSTSPCRAAAVLISVKGRPARPPLHASTNARGETRRMARARR